VIWLVATMVAPGTDRATLVKFYQLVKPAGRGWDAIRKEAGGAPSPDSLPQAMLGWVLGCMLVYSALFGTGSFLYDRMPQFYAWLAVFVVSAWGVWRVLRAYFRTAGQ
jgi:hypothetical protein